jgi:hypothetical protein
MEQIIRDNISAIFALLGTIAGATLTFVGTWILKNREAKTRLLEKVLDRRIQAHENVIELSKMFRVMTSLGYTENDGELARTPVVMASRDSFNEFFSKFSHTGNESTTWLTTEVTREYNFVQDYLINLYEFLRDTDSNLFPEIGRLIRQDFINFSTNLEKLSFKFFTRDLTKWKLNDLTKWHKYPVETTVKRLNETVFFKKKDEIFKVINNRKTQKL